jgi:hypothetical protein
MVLARLCALLMFLATPTIIVTWVSLVHALIALARRTLARPATYVMGTQNHVSASLAWCPVQEVHADLPVGHAAMALLSRVLVSFVTSVT